MIEFKQNISKKLFKKAIAYHYFSYKYTYINPSLGLLLLIFYIVFNIKFHEIFEPSHLIIVLISLFLMLRPIIYIQNVYRSSTTNKTLHKETYIKITEEDKIITTVSENISTLNLSDLYAYLERKNIILLYLAKNQYLVLNKEQLTDSDYETLINRLMRLNIKKR